MHKMHKGTMGLALSALLLLLLFGGASASALDLNLTNDYCNKSQTGGSQIVISYALRDVNVALDGNWINATDINCSLHFPTVAGQLDGKYDGNFHPSCTDTNLADSTTCSITALLPNPGSGNLTDYYPTMVCTDNNNSLDNNSYANCAIHTQRSCAVNWLPLITAMIIAGIILIVAGFVATQTGNATFSFILLIVAVATVVITLIPTLNCAV